MSEPNLRDPAVRERLRKIYGHTCGFCSPTREVEKTLLAALKLIGEQAVRIEESTNAFEAVDAKRNALAEKLDETEEELADAYKWREGLDQTIREQEAEIERLRGLIGSAVRPVGWNTSRS